MDQKLQSHGRRASNEDRLIHTVSSQISGMGLCFNIQLQESILGDVETNMNDDSRGAVGQQGNQQGDLFLPPIVQVDFPKFDGSNSTSWFLRCNNYFKLVPNIPDAHKIKMACLNLEGRAAAWYKGSRMGQTELSWSQFVAIILARFESIKGAKILVELSKLKHTDSYDDYVDKFEELKDHLVLLNQGRYTEDHFIASFIGGVCKDMQVAINLVEPTTLRQAIEFGREHLLSTQEITRKLKPSVNVEQNKQTEMEDLSLEFSDVSKVSTEFPPSKGAEHRIIFKPNRVLKHQFLYIAPHNHKGEIERILKEDIEVVYTPTVFDTLTKRSFDPGGHHVFDVVFDLEMQVMCMTELEKTKMEIVVEENEVDEKLSVRLIDRKQNGIHQDLEKLVNVNISLRDMSALIDEEVKVLDIIQVQESEVPVKQWGMMCIDLCSGEFKTKIGADFLSQRPLPKPPPMSKYYHGDSIVLKTWEEIVIIWTSELVAPVKEETEESKMLSVLEAKGSSNWDPEGNKYIDFLSAYSVVNQGHGHSKIMKVLVEQSEKLILSSRALYNDRFPKFAERLTSIFGYDMVLLMNTSAEGVETELKLGRKWGYLKKEVSRDKAIIVSRCGCFHRLTLAAISTSCDNEATCGFWPLLLDHRKVDFGDFAVLKKIFKEKKDGTVSRSGCNVDLLASKSNLSLSNGSTRLYHTTATWRNGSEEWIVVGHCGIYTSTTCNMGNFLKFECAMLELDLLVSYDVVFDGPNFQRHGNSYEVLQVSPNIDYSLDFEYVQSDIDQWWKWTKIGIGLYGWCLGVAETYKLYLGGGIFDVSLLTIKEGILEVNDLLMLVVAEVVRCRGLDKMFDRPPRKPPFQFRHLSLGDKTLSNGGYCHGTSKSQRRI